MYRRMMISVMVSLMFGKAGLAEGLALGALLAQDMLGTGSNADVLTALFTLGSAAKTPYHIADKYKKVGSDSSLPNLFSIKTSYCA